MDFLTQQEITGFKTDLKNGETRTAAEKTLFEQKLLNGLGEEMKDAVEHPQKQKKDKFAKKANRKKRRTIWKENLKKIFGGTKKETI